MQARWQKEILVCLKESGLQFAITARLAIMPGKVPNPSLGKYCTTQFIQSIVRFGRHMRKFMEKNKEPT